MSISNENELLAYRSFWEENLQKVEEVAAHLEKNLLALEKKHKNEQEQYQELEKRLDFLLSVYSSYNCFKGREYLLKLKACLSSYAHQTHNASARFDVLHFLLAKVKEQASAGFEEFPRVKHEYRDELPQKNIEAKTLPLPFRWITFRASAQWYIAACDELHIVDRVIAETRETSEGNEYIIFNGMKIKIVNRPTRRAGSDEPVRCYLIIARGGNTSCFSASAIGRRIRASKNVISPRLKEYTLVRKKYIRLFGKNHIFIDM